VRIKSNQYLKMNSEARGEKPNVQEVINDMFKQNKETKKKPKKEKDLFFVSSTKKKKNKTKKKK